VRVLIYPHFFIFKPNKNKNMNSKTISCDSTKMTVCYTDTNKHFVYHYQNDKQVIKPIEKKRFNFNPNQQRLFRQALFGINQYNAKTLNKMDFNEKLLINRMHNRAAVVLNQWKKELADDVVDAFLLVFFPNSKLAKKLTEPINVIPEGIQMADFKELGVTPYQIAQKLVDNKVLPQNFFQLC